MDDAIITTRHRTSGSRHFQRLFTPSLEAALAVLDDALRRGERE